MKFHVIKDPVHGTMQFTAAENAWIKPFIDSPHFQRLRHIKQLGMGDYIFPGAVHTRFNHCLGCCYVAAQIAHKIGLADEERQLVMTACLLHDIGHGPFSHVFEDIFQKKTIRHEDWTPYFLSDYGNSDFFLHYNQLNPRYHLTEEKFRIIEAMIMHKPVAKSVLADMVSSQLDADRLDYLLRDSHFCGVKYGEFDFRWMLNCLAIVPSSQGERLGITYKGIGAVEHYLMARRLMTRNIYHVQKKLALEFFLVQMLSKLAQQIEENPLFADIRVTRLGKFLAAANQFNQARQQGESNQEIDAVMEERKQHFLQNNYEHYRSLCDYDVYALINHLAGLSPTHAIVQLAERLYHRRPPVIVRLEQFDIRVVKAEIQEFKAEHHDAFQDWQIALIHTPHQSYSGEEDPILVLNEREEIQPLTPFSSMIQGISDKLEHTIFLCLDQDIAKDSRVQSLIKKWQRLQ